MKTKIHHFNLVEVIIAMGIIVVCITTIMGLFSVGISISKETVMKTYSNTVVEQVVGACITHPDIKDDIPDYSGGTAAPTSFEYNTAHYYKGYEDTTNVKPDTDFSGTLFKPDADGNGPQWDSGSPSIKDTEDALTTLLDTRTSNPNVKIYHNSSTPGLYKIEFLSSISGSEIVDFSVIARAWYTIREDGSDSFVTSYNNEVIDLERALRVEISWPPHEPYMNRLLQGQVLYFDKEL